MLYLYYMLSSLQLDAKILLSNHDGLCHFILAGVSTFSTLFRPHPCLGYFLEQNTFYQFANMLGMRILFIQTQVS